MKIVLATLAVLAFAGPALAQPALKGPLIGLRFLVGDWKSVEGKVADTGGTSKGTSRFTVAADGWMLLRQDHTDTFDKQGKPAGSFDQTMVVYAEGGGIHADYIDGEGHVIHYTSVDLDPGRLAVFHAPAAADRPGFDLTYNLITTTGVEKWPGGDLMVWFELRPLGGSSHTVAEGVLRRAKPHR